MSEDDRIETIRRLRTICAHLLSKLEDSKIEVGRMLDVAERVEKLAGPMASELREVMEQLEESIDGGVGELIKEIRRRDDEERKRRMLAMIRQLRPDETEEERDERLKRFGIEDEDKKR